MSVGKNNPQTRSTRMIKREVKWAGILSLEGEDSGRRPQSGGVAQTVSIGNGCSLQKLGRINQALKHQV